MQDVHRRDLRCRASSFAVSGQLVAVMEMKEWKTHSQPLQPCRQLGIHRLFLADFFSLGWKVREKKGSVPFLPVLESIPKVTDLWAAIAKAIHGEQAVKSALNVCQGLLLTARFYVQWEAVNLSNRTVNDPSAIWGANCKLSTSWSYEEPSQYPLFSRHYTKN